MIYRIGNKAIAMAVALLVLLLLTPVAGAQEDEDPQVRGVLFFSPTCGHCEFVIQNTLPPLFDENGGPWEVLYDESLEDEGVPFYLLDNGTLQFLLVDVSVETGSELFTAATDHYNIDSNGVPRMIIKDEVYIGSGDIPAALPGIIVDGLEGEGVDWPAFAGVEDAVATTVSADDTTTTAAPETTTTPTSAAATGDDTTTTTEATGGSALPTADDESLTDRFGKDPVGNSFAVIVLIGMVASLVGIAVTWRRPQGERRLGIAIPIIALAGIGVAGYLSYIEASGADAVCGPVGDCNAVQQSEYAKLFGLMPVGVLGLIGYLVVVGAWLVARADHNPRSDVAKILLFAGTVGGVLLSAYLTFLEPFVIGATCAWCLTSAVIITVLMWLAVGPATDSWSKLRRDNVAR